MKSSMKIIVGKGSCGIAAGAQKLSDYLQDKLNGIEVEIGTTGCIGMCYLEPMVDVIHTNGEKDTFVKVTDKAADQLVKMLAGEENTAASFRISQEDAAVLASQTRIALRYCGVIDPENIDAYTERGGYKGLKKVLTKMSPQDVINEMKASGLGGRGGAGYPTWFKWQAARDANAGEMDKKCERSEPPLLSSDSLCLPQGGLCPTERNRIKYVICNADEGDPGAFMDRAVIEGDPHSLIEGMLIAAYAIGSSEGVVYVRAEYPLAITRLEIAMAQAYEKGMLGKNIFGTNFSFDLRIKAGAGAFVCGEETALIASLEGERGMPRLKPPFPAQRGYWAQPTNINNVETYANVPWIIENGGLAFAAIGTEDSKGTKVFALTGKIKNGGLVEVPMGKTIRDVVFGIGGGIRNERSFKAVQVGGPAGGCIPESLTDTPISYKSLTDIGTIMGSGGMVVMDDTTCMVDMARFFLDFTCKESCGKCTHCRVGTKRMLEILERLTNGEGKDGDIEQLETLGRQIKEGALCNLGNGAPNPVLTTIKYFRHEYEAHINQKKCPAKQCLTLLRYNINDKCVGCTLCARKCPTNAISGERKEKHIVDHALCVKCGECAKVCKFEAVEVD